MTQKKVAWLKVNESCNFRCNWCIEKNDNYNPCKQMSYDLARQIVKAVKDIGISNIVIIGGEPSLWHPLFDFNQYCSDNDIRTCLATNGYMFGIDDFWNQYLLHPNDSIYLSIKSVREEQFSSFIGQDGLFQTTLNGINRISRYNDDVGAEMVLSERLDLKDICDMANFVEKCGIKYFTIDICISNEASQSNTTQIIKTTIESYDYINKIFKDRLTYQIFSKLCDWPDDFIQQIERNNQLISVCQSHDGTGIVFDTDGNIIQCYASKESIIARYEGDGYNLGNLPQLYENISSNRINRSDLCIDCGKNILCSGGCIHDR